MYNATFPATFIALPYTCEGQRAAFYLAAEEYIASTLPEGSYLFTWQLAPTVVIGRNQDAETEIDLGFCKTESIDVIRRKSGGGSVYADEGNIMVSLITKGGPVESLFKEYAHQVSHCLRAIGAEVEVSGRNDITLAGGGKICGNAFYHLANRNIVHGTMLYDTDARLMKGALTPERAKLLSKGVKSVESRISLLKDTLPHITVGLLREEIKKHLTDGTIHLTEEDVTHIRKIEQGYYEPSFLRTSATDTYATAHTHAGCQRRINGCGSISLAFETEEQKVKSVRVRGDYFELDNAPRIFNDAFSGCPFNAEALCLAAEEKMPNKSIRGLELCELTSMLKEMFHGNDKKIRIS